MSTAPSHKQSDSYTPSNADDYDVYSSIAQAVRQLHPIQLTF